MNDRPVDWWIYAGLSLALALAGIGLVLMLKNGSVGEMLGYLLLLFGFMVLLPSGLGYMLDMAGYPRKAPSPQDEGATE